MTTETTARSMARDASPNTILCGSIADGTTRWCNAVDAELAWADAAILTALGAPIPDDLLGTDPDTPLLRWADHDVPAESLLEAMLNPPDHRAKTCDRCAASLRRLTVSRLWIPCSQSAVEIQVCGHCRNVLEDVYRAAPRRGGPEGRVLVWRD